MSLFDNIKYPFSKYSLISGDGDDLLPEVPYHIFEKWGIRLIEDNKHICIDKIWYDNLMKLQGMEESEQNIVIHQFANYLDRQIKSGVATADSGVHLLHNIISLFESRYCGGTFRDFYDNLFDTIMIYTKEQFVIIGEEKYCEAQFTTRVHLPIEALLTLKYEGWLREEIYNNEL